MACRQRHKLFAPVVEEWIGGDEECTGTQLDEGRVGALEFVLGTGIQYMELHPLRARCFLNVAHVALDMRIVGFTRQGDRPGLRNQLGKQLEVLPLADYDAPGWLRSAPRLRLSEDLVDGPV